MDLNDYQPYQCVSDQCRGERFQSNIDSTQYYKPSSVPECCPLCGKETLVKLQRICLVFAEKNGKFAASQRGREQHKTRGWTYYCGRSNDEHSKHNIVQHTCVPEAANCPECLAKYNQTLELAGSLLRVRE